MTARYSDDLHELLEKLILLGEIATLSYGSKLANSDMDVSIDVTSRQSTDRASQKSEWEFSHNMPNLLEEWDEPIQRRESEQVRLHCMIYNIWHVYPSQSHNYSYSYT